MSNRFIKASGNQCNGAILTSSGYFVFGIPLAWFFGIHQGLGVMGIWIGPLVACAYLALTYNFMICFFNWDKLYEEIDERRRVENQERSRLLALSMAGACGNYDSDDEYKNQKGSD